MKIHSITLGLLIAFVSGASFAQWQWLGKDGRQVFSDRAPGPDIPEKNIVKRPFSVAAANGTAAADDAAAPATAPAAALVVGKPAEGGLDKELEAKKKQAEAAEAAKRKAAEQAFHKAKVENCARAKQALATLDSGVRMRRTNDAGEPEILDDAARAAERKKIQAVISTDCN